MTTETEMKQRLPVGYDTPTGCKKKSGDFKSKKWFEDGFPLEHTDRHRNVKFTFDTNTDEFKSDKGIDMDDNNDDEKELY